MTKRLEDLIKEVNGYHGCGQDLRDACLEVLDQQLSIIAEEVEKMRKIKKPIHGPCCTCQSCGYSFDDCECEYNQAVSDVLNLIKKGE